MTSQISPQRFDAFVESLTSAGYDAARSLPGAEVESRAAFEEMRHALREQYQSVGAVASFVEADGQIIDCIPVEQHPAVKRAGGGTMAPPPAEAQPAPEPYGATPPAFLSPSSNDVTGVLPRARDAGGAELRATYPPGTIPMYRTTLEQMSRFRNLAAYNAKDRREELAAPAASAFPKRYATGEQDIDCLGGGSYVNVWRPFATPSFQATFSQQWYLAGHDGTLLQTVECGWHVDITRYGNAEPHLFVYSTRQNYDPGHSFFNQELGSPYVPATNPYVLPGAPLAVSQTDGTQVAYKMGFYLTAGAWWFYFDDHPVGYYPLTWFNNGPLTSGAKRIRFGGEVGAGLLLWPPMGSGQHASAGHGKAAYHRGAFVNPTSGGGVYATLAEAGSVTGSCYSIDITNNSASEWGTYLFFGGPGGQPC
jgi:hypothetical protein